MQRPLRASAPRSTGYAVVLLGVMGFVVGCFLPYVSFNPRPFAPSLYQMQTMRHTGLGWVGAVLILFSGAAALAVISSLALRRQQTWSATALVSIAAVWALEQIGFALGASGLWPTKAVGYWLVLTAVGVVGGGAIIVGVQLVREPIPERPDSSSGLPAAS